MNEDLEVTISSKIEAKEQLSGEVYEPMPNIFEEEAEGVPKTFDVFKTEDGDWVVDMTQFGEVGDGKVVSKQYKQFVDFC